MTLFVREHGIEKLANGWCFLENIQNPEKPTDNCYEDTQFSVRDGRFWSNEACTQQGVIRTKRGVMLAYVI